MSLLQSNENGFEWYNSLDDARADGFGVVKVTSLLCFFQLRPRVTVVSMNNLEVISDLFYLYEGRESDDAPLKYYKKQYRGYDLETLYFYRQSLTFSGQDEAIDIFRYRCKDGLVHLLLNGGQIEDVSSMLTRIYKAQFHIDGKMPYRLWLALAENEIMYEDYRRVAQNATGYNTMCKIFETKSKEIWDKATPFKK